MDYYKMQHNYEDNKRFNCSELWMKRETFGLPTYADSYIREYTKVDFISPYSLKKLADFPGNCGCWLLVSLKFEKVLKAYGKQNFLIADANIFNEKSIGYKKYKLIHLIKEVNAIDKNKTKYHEFIEQHQLERIVDHSSLVLMKRKLNNHHIFRVKEIPGHYYVSDQLKQEIESAGFTGVKFEFVNSE